MRRATQSRQGRALTLVAVAALAWLCVWSAAARAADRAACAPPVAGADWPVVPPEAADFDAAALCAVLEEAAASKANLHGLLVERRGRLVAELYRTGHDDPIDVHYGLRDWFAPDVAFGPDALHDVRSISKSVVSLVLGIAREEGKLADLSTPALDFFPELADLRTDGRAGVTLEHLLTMSSGLDWKEWGRGVLASDETRLFWKSDLARFVFDRKLAASPGARFNYNGGSTATLAELLARAGGKPLLERVRADLFEPLGIAHWTWARDLRGRPIAYAGLRLRPRDLLKLGRLALDGGRWRGRQIVPEAWLRESLRAHVGTGMKFVTSEDEVGYGYQWWTGRVPWRGRALGWSAGVGNGGQRLFIVPELDLVVVTTAGEYGSPQIGEVVGRLFAKVVAAARE